MSKITMDNLSDNLKAYMDSLGLSEEQVLELIKNNISGDLEGLNTSDKSSLVAAINELFQNANNGKELIATAIGEPLNSSDTFSAMSTGINGLTSNFKAALMNNGVSVASTDKFKQLIEKIASLADSEGKGIQYATGTVNMSKTTAYSPGAGGVNNPKSTTINTNLDFTPTLVFVELPLGICNIDTDFTTSQYMGLIINNIIPTGIYYSWITYFTINNISAESFDIYGYITGSRTTDNLYFPESTFTWYAIGVGEEDTTLEDSLRDILGNKGVEVSPEDDLASLIAKVDEEFSKSQTIFPKWYKKGSYATFTDLPVGGWDLGSCVYNDDVYTFYESNAYCLDMDTGNWRTISKMPTSRSGPSAACVGDKIYVIGGSSNKNNECYDPATDTWTTKTSRNGTGVTRNVVYNNIIYFFGNRNSYSPADCYDPATDTWTTKSGGPSSRTTLDNTVGLINDKIYFIGSYTSSPFMYIYDPKTGAYTTGTATNINYNQYAGSAVYNNIFYFFCGYSSYSCFAYDPLNDTGWAITSYPSGQSVEHISSIAYKNYIINLGGEYYSSGRSYSRTYCFAFIPE